VGFPHSEEVDVPLDEVSGIDRKPSIEAGLCHTLPGVGTEMRVEVLGGDEPFE
jgi:hypothetical protein